MGLDVSLHECVECGEKFLSELALRGHQSTHSESVKRYRGETA